MIGQRESGESSHDFDWFLFMFYLRTDDVIIIYIKQIPCCHASDQ